MQNTEKKVIDYNAVRHFYFCLACITDVRIYEELSFTSNASPAYRVVQSLLSC